MDDPHRIRFGGFVLNRVRGCLEDGTGCERFLRPKSYRALEVLCERRGRLVSKDDLVREIWPDVFVSDDSLAHCVSDIRRVLGPDGAKLLRTVPRRGYMLLDSEPGPELPVRRTSSPRMVWAGGLAAGLLLVAGSLWWATPRIAIEAAPDVTVSAMQQAEALLEARDWRRREDNERARRLLEQVVAGDPENPDALASLGLTYWLEVQHLAWGGGRREMERALELVERSVAFGGSDRSHRLLAEMRLLAPFRELRSPVDALASARAAAAIDPGDADNMAVLAQALALTGRSKDAVGMIEQALRLSSNPPDWHRQVAGLSYLLAGEPARAAEKLGPLYGAGTFANARWWPGWLFAASLAHAGRTDEAAGVVRAAQGRRSEYSVSAVAQSFDGFADETGLALVLDGLRLAGMPG
ncbi:winged helix-turn-helix domain-containing protein [Chelativorans xinjiangense]|uniref:winged helix-turn-helix domain-containing protein n=1 Tax=Chelativorans xinjiangense TaxID=2681485 RepID=UPI00135A54FD|nr:winged helix-turn-helix domain-containing protein [Chelativorans xinjiangense]